MPCKPVLFISNLSDKCNLVKIKKSKSDNKKPSGDLTAILDILSIFMYLLLLLIVAYRVF